MMKYLQIISLSLFLILLCGKSNAQKWLSELNNAHDYKIRVLPIEDTILNSEINIFQAFTVNQKIVPNSRLENTSTSIKNISTSIKGGEVRLEYSFKDTTQQNHFLQIIEVKNVLTGQKMQLKPELLYEGIIDNYHYLTFANTPENESLKFFSDSLYDFKLRVFEVQFLYQDKHFNDFKECESAYPKIKVFDSKDKYYRSQRIWAVVDITLLTIASVSHCFARKNYKEYKEQTTKKNADFIYEKANRQHKLSWISFSAGVLTTIYTGYSFFRKKKERKKNKVKNEMFCKKWKVHPYYTQRSIIAPQGESGISIEIPIH